MTTTEGTTRPVLELERICVRYGRTLAADAVSLSVPAGAVYALLGRNGAGKSSLVRCLLGQQRPDRLVRRGSSATTPGRTGPA